MSAAETDFIIPEGYTTAAALATEYGRTPACIRERMVADNVPHLRIPRQTDNGRLCGGRPLWVYHAESAHAALTRPAFSRAACPGYISRLATAFHCTREEVRAVLEAAGIHPTPRTCPTCGKKTLFYHDRRAAHATMRDHRKKAHKLATRNAQCPKN